MELKKLSKKNSPQKNNFIAIAVAILVVLVVALMVFRPDTDSSTKPPADTPPLSEQTVEGEAVCLPHKDTSGPQTLECAFGIKLDDGTYYALRDTDQNYKNVSSLQTGERYRVTGTLKPENSDKYQSTGTLTVTSIGTMD